MPIDDRDDDSAAAEYASTLDQPEDQSATDGEVPTIDSDADFEDSDDLIHHA